MTQDPFAALGAGGFDMNALLQQAQQMQEELARTQEQLHDAEIEGVVAGGAVTVTVNGVGELTAVTISPDAVDASEPDALADLGDLIVAAYRDAKAKADSAASQALGPLAGGLGGLGGPGGVGGGDAGPGQLG